MMDNAWKVRIFWATLILVTVSLVIGFSVWNKTNSLEYRSLNPVYDEGKAISLDKINKCETTDSTCSWLPTEENGLIWGKEK